MSLKTKQWIIMFLGAAFIVSLILVQGLEHQRRLEEAGKAPGRPIIKGTRHEQCVKCHQDHNPGIIGHWENSTHARKGVGCVDCHEANKNDADAFLHHSEDTYIANSDNWHLPIDELPVRWERTAVRRSGA